MMPRCMLLDIEGTTSSIRFVYDVMFPYVRANLSDYLGSHWNTAAVQQCLPFLANDLQYDNLESWLDVDAKTAAKTVEDAVQAMMDQDLKATGLKMLQGRIWKDGFESGQLIAHVFDDVPSAIRNWHADGIQIRIYSSGSVEAQKLFFSHTLAGNLLPMFTAHYDTNIGPKKSMDSYRAIANDASLLPEQVVFVSDVGEELDAARQAGMRAVLSVRPGNKPLAEPQKYHAVHAFNEIDFKSIYADA